MSRISDWMLEMQEAADTAINRLNINNPNDVFVYVKKTCNSHGYIIDDEYVKTLCKEHFDTLCKEHFDKP